MKPTAWYLYHFRDPDTGAETITNAARSYWPNSTRAEINDGKGWVSRPILLDLSEDPGWELVDESTANVWVSAHRAA